MVSLTISPATKGAIDEFLQGGPGQEYDVHEQELRDKLSKAETGNQIEHDELIRISRRLVQHLRLDDPIAKRWRLDTLLKGSDVFKPPPPPKPEPTPEYKALMQRLREREEQRQYERMTNPPPPHETFRQRFPNAPTTFGGGVSIGSDPLDDEVDEVTYADVNRQMILIINVLVSIIACSVAIWMAARRWSVPQRLALSFSGSTVVALAEVAIYMGYIRRIQEAKTTEVKKVERKEVFDTWVIDAKATTGQPATADTLRFRKGRHR